MRQGFTADTEQCREKEVFVRKVFLPLLQLRCTTNPNPDTRSKSRYSNREQSNGTTHERIKVTLFLSLAVKTAPNVNT